MAKFIYKMQNILDIKLKLEEQAKTAFAAANAKLLEEENKLRAIKDRKARYEEEYKININGNIDRAELIALNSGIARADLDIDKQLLVIRNARGQVDFARTRLENAIYERKIQEKLKENAFEKFKLEVASAENKEVDELVSFLYGNKIDEEEIE